MDFRTCPERKFFDYLRKSRPADLADGNFDRQTWNRHRGMLDDFHVDLVEVFHAEDAREEDLTQLIRFEGFELGFELWLRHGVSLPVCSPGRLSGASVMRSIGRFK